jgi:hypothetical protein
MEVVVTGHNFESILPKDHPFCDPDLHPRWQPSANIVLTYPMGNIFKNLLL